MKAFTVLLASLVVGAPAIARSYYGSNDECYKLQTEWFEAMVSVCNKYPVDGNPKGSFALLIQPPKAIQTGRRSEKP